MSAEENARSELRADVAQCAKAQVKRRGGELIWSLDNCHDVIPSLRPEYLLRSHSKRLRHLLEGFCPLRRVFSVFDALIGKRGKHDIGYHGRSPWLLVYLILPPDPAEGSLEDFMPKLDGILETAIHTEDMVRARAFYEDVLGLEPIYSDNRLSAYAVAGRDVLLVFRKGTTRQTAVLPSGTIPGHGGDGVLHVAFAIGKDELDRWEAHLDSRGVAIEGRNDWERGGRSIYFRDPDGHLLELATPGLWSIY